ncbi:MAG: hypothetical protein ACK5PB_14525 [Pirellula sp.]|jgi:hypothetical protein
MKKTTNNIIAALVSTAVIGVAIGYGITFWEHWRANQNVLSSNNSSPNSTRPVSDTQTSTEPAILEAPAKLIFIDEAAS